MIIYAPPTTLTCPQMPMQLTLDLNAGRLRQFYQLTKPRVLALIVFCAVIGMFLATPGMVPPGLLVAATVGYGWWPAPRRP